MPEVQNQLGIREQIRYAIFVALLFLAVPALGTVSHELGHAAVGLAVGQDVRMHYGSCDISGGTDAELSALLAAHRDEIRSIPDSPIAQRYIALAERARIERLWFILGGPISTMLIGTSGLVGLMLMRRRHGYQSSLTPAGWTLTILALFWSRELFILAQHITGLAMHKPGRSDETTIAHILGLPHSSVTIVLGVLGLSACLIATLWHPRERRVPFVLGGVTGCALGFILWFYWLGPWLLP